MGSECAVDICDRPVYCRSWCTAHYGRWRYHKDVRPEEPIRVTEKKNGLTEYGYIRHVIREHPLADKKHRILEHWEVMYESNPSFAIWAKENRWTIHHKNGVRHDNHRVNLEWRAPGKHEQGWSVPEMIEALERMGYEVI